MKKLIFCSTFVLFLVMFCLTTMVSQNINIWKGSVNAVTLQNLSSAGQYYDPQFAPNGKDWLSFEVDKEGYRALYILNFDKATSNEISPFKKVTNDNLLEPTSSASLSAGFNGQLVWCPQKIGGEQWFAFVGSNGTNEDIFLGSVRNLSEMYRITSDPLIDDNPVWSPDGKKLAFTSRRSGRSDIYLINDIPGLLNRMREQVEGKTFQSVGESIDNGKWVPRFTDNPNEEIFPVWSPDGNSLAYTVLNGDVSGSQLVVKGVAGGSVPKVIYEEPSNVLRNPSFSRDGKYLALYSAGSKVDETVDLIVLQLSYSSGMITEAKVKWSKEQVRRFEEVKSRIHGGPYWGEDGSLYFLNEKKGQKNVLLQIDAESFLRSSGRPTVNSYLISGDQTGGAVEFSIREFDFAKTGKPGPEIAFSAQKGNQFGIYSDLPVDVIQRKPVVVASTNNAPSIPLDNSALWGIASGVFQYSGDAKSDGFSPGTELFLRYPLSNELSITGVAGFGQLQGSALDANGKKWAFVSSIYYFSAMPSYRVLASDPFSILLKAGGGVAYVNNKRVKTKGVKFLIPVQAELDYNITPGFIVFLNGGINISTGDLDGLRSPQKSDRFMVINIGIANLLSPNIFK